MEEYNICCQSYVNIYLHFLIEVFLLVKSNKMFTHFWIKVDLQNALENLFTAIYILIIKSHHEKYCCFLAQTHYYVKSQQHRNYRLSSDTSIHQHGLPYVVGWGSCSDYIRVHFKNVQIWVSKDSGCRLNCCLT